MRKNRGQALVEFVLILPVFLLILFSIIDFGRLFYEKMQLSNRFDDSLEVLKENNDYDGALMVLNRGSNNEATLETTYYDSYIEVTTEMELELITPGLNLILGNPYKLKIERTVPYEMEIDPTDQN